MTLRVELSIVPFGDETKKRIIETINISNIGLNANAVLGEEGYYDYVVEHNDYKHYDEQSLRISHKRADGGIRLAGSALMALSDFGCKIE
jgi:hypothetical protein